MNMTRAEIERIIHECIDELFAKDLCLLENDVSERAITHKLAEYLQHRIPDLNVDCEYNRNTTKGKNAPKQVVLLKNETQRKINAAVRTGELDDLLAVSTYPDIIVHRRMTNSENLLVVEVKKRNSHVGRDHDYDKLRAFTENSKRNSYHFRYGVFILLDTDRKGLTQPELSWFAEGRDEQISPHSH